MEHFKSFIARRRWKVQMKCESRSVRTVTTKYLDSEGNLKSKKRAELTGKSVLYEGEYSETDSETESEHKNKGTGVKNLGTFNVTDNRSLDSINLSGSGSRGSGNHHKPQVINNDSTMFTRQKLLDQIPNVELKPVKVIEFSESIDQDSDDEAPKNNLDSKKSISSSLNENKNPLPPNSSSGSAKLTQAELQAKINDHLKINSNKSGDNNNNNLDKKNIIKDETKEDEKSDIKIIDSTDQKTGLAIRTSIENKMKTNENIKVCKDDEKVEVNETEDAIIKKITTKTKTTKSVIKTTTTTTVKKGTL
jgi:hypothetical protein